MERGQKMRKYISILLILAAVLSFCGCEEKKTEIEDTTIAEKIESPKEDYPFVIWSEGDVKLCAKDEDASIYYGKDEKLMLTVGEDSMYFEGSYGLYASTRSAYHSADITKDGVSDHILTLSTDAIGEGACGEELHVFDGATLCELPLEDSFDTVSKKFYLDKETVTTDNSNTGYYTYTLTLDGKVYHSIGINPILSLDLPIIDRAHEFFTVEDGTLYSNYYLIHDEAHVLSLGIIKTAYEHNDGTLSLKKSVFEEERKQLYNNQTFCETGNKDWRMIADYNNHTITLKSSQVYTLELPVYFHDKVYYTPSIKPYAVISEDESIAAIVYIKDREGNNYGCYEEAATSCVTIVDLKSGEIADTFCFEREDILKAHDLNDDATAPYEAAYSRNHSALSILINMRETNENVLEMGILLVSDDKQIMLTGSAEYNTDTKKLSEYKAGGNFFGDIPVYESDDLDDIDYLDYLDSFESYFRHTAKKDCARAFLEKDTAKLEELLGCRKGVLEQYKDFEFEDTRFKVVNSDLQLTVKITKSSLDTVPVGEYTVTFEQGRWGAVYLDGLSEGNKDPSAESETSLASLYTNYWISSFGNYDLNTIQKINDATEKDWDTYKNDILKFLHVRGNLNYLDYPETYKNAAKDIFGLVDLKIPDTMINSETGTVELWGHGGFIRPGQIVSETKKNGIITVQLQTYADFQRTVKSDLYEFKYEDHGEYLKFISIELVQKGEYEPEDRYIA